MVEQNGDKARKARNATIRREPVTLDAGKAARLKLMMVREGLQDHTKRPLHWQLIALSAAWRAWQMETGGILLHPPPEQATLPLANHIDASRTTHEQRQQLKSRHQAVKSEKLEHSEDELPEAQEPIGAHLVQHQPAARVLKGETDVDRWYIKPIERDKRQRLQADVWIWNGRTNRWCPGKIIPNASRRKLRYISLKLLRDNRIPLPITVATDATDDVIERSVRQYMVSSKAQRLLARLQERHDKRHVYAFRLFGDYSYRLAWFIGQGDGQLRDGLGNPVPPDDVILHVTGSASASSSRPYSVNDLRMIRQTILEGQSDFAAAQVRMFGNKIFSIRSTIVDADEDNLERQCEALATFQAGIIAIFDYVHREDEADFDDSVRWLNKIVGWLSPDSFDSIYQYLNEGNRDFAREIVKDIERLSGHVENAKPTYRRAVACEIDGYYDICAENVTMPPRDSFPDTIASIRKVLELAKGAKSKSFSKSL